MENSQIEKMQEIQVKLEDIHNSQSSLIEKIAHVLVELYNAPDADLEKKLDEIHTNASANASLTLAMKEDYQIAINREINENS